MPKSGADQDGGGQSGHARPGAPDTADHDVRGQTGTDRANDGLVVADRDGDDEFGESALRGAVGQGDSDCSVRALRPRPDDPHAGCVVQRDLDVAALLGQFR